MGCNCGKNQQQYLHIAPNGKTTYHASLNSVMTAVRQQGGTYKKA